MKALISAVLTLMLVTGIPACINFGPGECEGIEPYFNVIGIPQVEVFDKGSFFRLVTATDSVVFENHFLEAGFAVSFFSKIQPLPNRRVGFINTAYALDCNSAGYAGSKEGIDSLFITTTVDLDSTFAANDTINAIVEFSTDGNIFLSHTEFLKANKTALRKPAIQWRLTRKPTNLSVMHSFRIILKLSSGEMYTATSVPFFFR